MRAVIQQVKLPDTGRIIAISDVHGNLPYLKGLLARLQLRDEDTLVFCGDILEKGRYSLDTLRYIMRLASERRVLAVLGNCDFWQDAIYRATPASDEYCKRYLLSDSAGWGPGLLAQMCQEAGFVVGRGTDMAEFRRVIGAAFEPEFRFLESLPHVIDTEHYVFVHGGLPEGGREDWDGWKCMKNDNFLGQGRSFDRWVIVGHWPVTLYGTDTVCANPIIERERKIISIDGGCVLKLDGQLNALIIPEESSPDFSWTAYDGLPTARALDPQAPSEDSLNIRWGRNRVEVLERGPELSLCRHLETGRVLPILTSYLYDSPEGLRCEDSTDYLLPVVPGDCLSIVARTGEMGTLVKKNGVTGWDRGRLNDETKRETKGT